METTTDKMLAHVEDGIGVLIFNNPARHNAVSLEMWRAAKDIVDGFIADSVVRVIVVRGAGEKSFVSGADISRFDDERANREAVAVYEEATEAVYSALKSAPKPIIAMIQGYCIGGGLNLAVCCDLRFCNETARFAIPAARLGVGYGYNRIRRLLDVVSSSCASEIFFTARQFTATEAATMNLVNRVVPTAELETVTMNAARQIALNAPLVVASTKRIIQEALREPTLRDLKTCEKMVQACFEGQDYIEGRAAFREKRAPIFIGA